jgi:hypothetical protein
VFALPLAAAAVLATGVTASSGAHSQIRGTELSAQTALDWNQIAVNTVRSATLNPAKFQIEGLIYMAYVQAAEYNAVTAISGRYAPYRSSIAKTADASPRAALAAAAYTTLAYYFPTLAHVPERTGLAGIAVGAAQARNTRPT